MNVSVTPELEQFLQERVKAGRYGNVSEAVREAVRLLQERENRYERNKAKVRAMIEEGMEGPFTPGDMDSIIAEAKAERAAKRAAASE